MNESKLICNLFLFDESSHQPTGSFRKVSRLAFVQSVVDHMPKGCSSISLFLISAFCFFPPLPLALLDPLLEAGLFFQAPSLEYLLLLQLVVRKARTPLATLNPAPVIKTICFSSLMNRASSHKEEDPRPLRLLREGGKSSFAIAFLFLFLLVRRGDMRRFSIRRLVEGEESSSGALRGLGVARLMVTMKVSTIKF